MNIQELAKLYYEKHQMALEMGEIEPDSGDDIYCKIGELLQNIDNEELVKEIDLLILEMSEADKSEYYIKGFTAGAELNKK